MGFSAGILAWSWVLSCRGHGFEHVSIILAGDNILIAWMVSLLVLFFATGTYRGRKFERESAE